MAHFPAPLARAESDALAERIRALIEARGCGLWAVEVPDVCEFIGYVGLAEPRFPAPFTPCTEVGWWLARAHWGRGYATEAARGRRLGMRRDPADDFDHVAMPAGRRLRRHVLYRLARPVR